MRYLPLSTEDARRCSPGSASRRSTISSPTCRRQRCCMSRSTCRGTPARWRWSASSVASPQRISRPARSRSSSERSLQASCAGDGRHLIQRSEFLTSYTPYQPEIAQGTTQYLFEFQTQVANLTGMDVANASMYDGSTGAAEAVLMAHRVTKRKKAVLSGGLHPHYAEVIRGLSAMASDQVTSLPGRRRRRRRTSLARSTPRPPASSSRTPTSSATCGI